MGGLTRSSGVGAGVISSSAASIPTVISYVSLPMYHQPRVTQVNSDARVAVTQHLAYLCLMYVTLGYFPSLCSR